MNVVTQALIQKFAGNSLINDRVIAALDALPHVIRNVQPGSVLVRDGTTPHSSIVVIEGCVYRHKIVGDGKRQIFSFQIVGDMPDLQSLYLKKMDHTVSALGQATIASIPHTAIFDLIETTPAASHILWRESLIDAAIFREWIANTGQRNAVSRIAHLLCELIRRAEEVGLVKDKTYRIAITQAHFADATGMSLVHVNRSLKTLRTDGIVEWSKGLIKVMDWDALTEIGDFDDGYLEVK
jgi:CRP-like cAMP-binding protein